MGSWATLRIGPVNLISFKSVIHESVGSLFNSSDFYIEYVDIDWDQDADDIPMIDIAEYSVGTKSMADRLDLYGFGFEATKQRFDQLLENERNSERQFALLFGLTRYGETAQQRLDFLNSLTFHSWCIALANEANVKNSPNDENSPILEQLLSLWRDEDVRWKMRACLIALPDHPFILDVADLVGSEYLEEYADLAALAAESTSYQMSFNSPPIILTEGVSDFRILSSALHLRKPHLSKNIQFLEYDFKQESGAAALAKMVKSFAAAKMPNTFLAIFDNDSAGHYETDSLKKLHLPSNFIITTYPDLMFASEYPTVGPTGVYVMDVNGLAASIELYLGRDILTDSNGELRQVVWTSKASNNRYQGALNNKEELSRKAETRFREMESAPELCASFDWSGLDLILDHIQNLLAGRRLGKPEEQ